MKQGPSHTGKPAASHFLLALLILLGLAVYFAKSLFPDMPGVVIGPTPPVTTFGYDPMRSGHVVSRLNSSRPFQVQPANAALLNVVRNALSPMPLYINGAGLHGTLFDNRRIMLVPGGKGLYALDVDRARVLWTAETPPGQYVASTPVADLHTNRIYYYTVDHSDESGYQHHVYQVDFDGENQGQVYMDMEQIFHWRGEVSAGENWSRRLHCKTAMGLNRVVKPARIFFGCSVRTGNHSHAKYGELRGLSGIVASIQLENDGNFAKPESQRIFFTSALGPGTYTGFDSGVYNAGAGPALIPDGSLLVATGNGPAFLGQDNFGCSVIRLDGALLKPVTNEKGAPEAFSHSAPGFNECWYLNVEYSNSSIAVTQNGDDLVAAVLTKDGFLDVFDPLKMDSARTGVIRTRVANSPTFSQPALLTSSDRTRVVALGKIGNRNASEPDYLLVDEITLGQLSGVKQVACHGWLAATPGQGAPALSMLYSGPIRDDYAVAVKDSRFYRDMMSFSTAELGHHDNAWYKDGLWGPYVEAAILGYGLRPDQHDEEPRSRIERLESVRGYLDAKQAGSSHYTESAFWLLRNLDPERTCTLPHRPELTPVYSVVRQRPKLEANHDSVSVYDYSHSGKTLDMAWRYTLNPEDQLMGAHPVISSDADGKNAVVVVLVSSGKKEPVGGSAMLLLEGETGRLLARVGFNGETRFSMPLVFDEKIVIPTRRNGLQIFDLVKDSNHE